MSTTVDASLRDTLFQIAQQIFPLEAWVATRSASKIVDEPDLPWRAEGKALSFNSMRTMERFDRLIDADPNDDVLRIRWNEIAAAPLWFELSLPYPTDRREQLKLEDAAVFAPVDSDNFAIATENFKTKVKKPRARREFYAACWPMLKAAQAECLFPDPASWSDFAKSLFNDLLSEWPPTGPVKSSDFIKRFAKDLAICLLDMENPFLPATKEGDLWQRAVLIEAGEHRYRHNAYQPGQVQAAVDRLDRKLSDLIGATS